LSGIMIHAEVPTFRVWCGYCCPCQYHDVYQLKLYRWNSTQIRNWSMRKSGSKIKVMSRKAAALLALDSNSHSNCTYWLEL